MSADPLVTIYVPCRNYGRFLKQSVDSVINQLYPKIVSGLPSILFKSHRTGIPDGEQRRDFIWIDDCVEVMLWSPPFRRVEISRVLRSRFPDLRSTRRLNFWSLDTCDSKLPARFKKRMYDSDRCQSRQENDVKI